MKKLILFFFCLMTVLSVSADNPSRYYEQFVQLLRQQDTVALRKLLPEWEKEEGKTGDLYAAWANYYTMTARESMLSLSSGKPKEGEMALMLADSLGADTVGYIGGITHYEPTRMIKAFATLNEGIQKYPDRLDLHFGKIHLLFEDERYDEVPEAIHATLLRSKVNGNRWLWTNDVVAGKEGQQENMYLDGLQDYFNRLFENEAHDSIMTVVVDDVLHFYPDNLKFLNDKGALLAIAGKWSEALKVFLRLHESDREDEIVINNIARCYLEVGNMDEAENYFRRLLKSKDEGNRQQAEEGLKEVERRRNQK